MPKNKLFKIYAILTILFTIIVAVVFPGLGIAFNVTNQIYVEAFRILFIVWIVLLIPWLIILLWDQLFNQ